MTREIKTDVQKLETYTHLTTEGLRILIINHRSKTGPLQLKRILGGTSTKVVDYESLNFPTDDSGIDMVIVCGGNTYPVNQNKERLSKEMEFIRKTEKPVLGICYGFQVIAEVFGGELSKLATQRKQVVEIKKVKDDPIFAEIFNLEVWENHKYAVTSVGDELEILATSSDGVEIIKHKSKPIYGFQFHPEHKIENEDAVKFLQNFFNTVK